MYIESSLIPVSFPFSFVVRRLDGMWSRPEDQLKTFHIICQCSPWMPIFTLKTYEFCGKSFSILRVIGRFKWTASHKNENWRSTSNVLFVEVEWAVFSKQSFEFTLLFNSKGGRSYINLCLCLICFHMLFRIFLSFAKVFSTGACVLPKHPRFRRKKVLQSVL